MYNIKVFEQHKYKTLTEVISAMLKGEIFYGGEAIPTKHHYTKGKFWVSTNSMDSELKNWDSWEDWRVEENPPKSKTVEKIISHQGQLVELNRLIVERNKRTGIEVITLDLISDIAQLYQALKHNNLDELIVELSDGVRQEPERYTQREIDNNAFILDCFVECEKWLRDWIRPHTIPEFMGDYPITHGAGDQDGKRSIQGWAVDQFNKYRNIVVNLDSEGKTESYLDGVKYPS